MATTLHAAMKEPLLTVDLEREAIRRWQDEGDRHALELLLRSHARQAWSQALRFADDPIDLDDLVAEGMVGLMRAADSFDRKLELRFSTYAAFWVMNSVYTALSRIRTVIDMPVRTYFNARMGRLGHDDAGLSLLAMQGTIPIESSREGLSLSEKLPCESMTPAEQAEIRSAHSFLCRLLAEALAELDPVEQTIISRRRLAVDPECAQAVASDLQLSVQKLRQIETRALNRLRRSLLERGFNRAMLN